MKTNPRRVTVICVVVVVGLTILTAVFLFRTQISPQDEGLLLTYSDRLLRGAMPHRDYFTAYGPGGFWVMAGAFKLFGASLFVERCMGLIYRLAILLAVFFFGLRKGRIIAVIGSILCGMLSLANDLYAIAFLLALALAMWSLWLLSWQVFQDSSAAAPSGPCSWQDFWADSFPLSGPTWYSSPKLPLPSRSCCCSPRHGDWFMPPGGCSVFFRC